MKEYKIDGVVFVTRRILLARLEDLLFTKGLLDAVGEHIDYIYDVHDSTKEDSFGYRYVVAFMYNQNDERAESHADWVLETLFENVENCIVTDLPEG